MYKLHSFKESGNSYKVALALSMAGADWEKVQVEFFNAQTRQPAWRTFSIRTFNGQPRRKTS